MHLTPKGTPIPSCIFQIQFQNSGGHSVAERVRTSRMVQVYAVVFFPADNSVSVINQTKVKYKGNEAVRPGMQVKVPWTDALTLKTKLWKGVVTNLGENLKEMEQFASDICEKIRDKADNGDSVFDDVIVPIVGTIFEPEETNSHDMTEGKRKRKMTSIMKESISQDQDEQNHTKGKETNKKETDKKKKKTTGKPKENAADTHTTSKSSQKHAEITASIMSNNAMVQNLNEKINSIMKTNKHTGETENSAETSEKVATTHDPFLNIVTRENESLRKAPPSQSFINLLNDPSDSMDTLSDPSAVMASTRNNIGMSQIWRESVTSFMDTNSDNHEEETGYIELERTQDVINTLQNENNLLKKENEALHREIFLLKQKQTTLCTTNSKTKESCPVPSQQVVTYLKAFLQWTGNQQSSQTSLTLDTVASDQQTEQPLPLKKRRVETTSRPESLEREKITLPRRQSPRKEKQSGSTENTTLRQSPRKSPRKEKQSGSTENASLRRSPRKSPRKQSEENETVTTPRKSPRKQAKALETPRRSPRKPSEDTEMTAGFLYANLEPKEGGNTSILLKGYDVQVNRLQLRSLLSKSRNLKMHGPSNLLRKLILLVFKMEELAESRGQGLMTVNDKTGKPPLNTEKCHVCKEFVNAYCKKEGLPVLSDKEVNSIFTQQVSYARNKIQRVPKPKSQEKNESD